MGGKKTGRTLRALKESSLERGKPFIIPLPKCYVCERSFLSESDVVRVNISTESCGLLKNVPIHVECFKGIGMRVPGGRVVEIIEAVKEKTIKIVKKEDKVKTLKRSTKSGIEELSEIYAMSLCENIRTQICAYKEQLKALEKCFNDASAQNKPVIMKKIAKLSAKIRKLEMHKQALRKVLGEEKNKPT